MSFSRWIIRFSGTGGQTSITILYQYHQQGYFWDGPEPFFEKIVEERLNLI